MGKNYLSLNCLLRERLLLHHAELYRDVDGLGDAAQVEAGHHRVLQRHFMLFLKYET